MGVIPRSTRRVETRFGPVETQQRLRRVLLVVLAAVATAGCAPTFSERTTQQALVLPTSIAFAPDGRVFVAEKRGTIQTYDSIDDPTPQLFADLREQVQNTDDHGLLGIEVDRSWPSRPYVYIQYSYDAPVGGTAPTYGVGTDSDPCPEWFGACRSQGRVARLTSGADGRMSELTVLTQDVCFAFTYHGGGGLRMASDGAIVASFGEGAYPVAPGTVGESDGCTDPPFEGGSLRSQDLRTSGDPVGLSGTVIRIDPDTGAPWPTNPLIGSSDPNARKVIGYGLRNPFRLAIGPGASQVWVADVGQQRAEEVNRLDVGAPVENFGWPCREGGHAEPDMAALNLPLCTSLSGATGPHHTYCHSPTPPGQLCNVGGGAISGIELYASGSYPAKYHGALFFADYTRNEIRVMLPTGGVPDPNKVEAFMSNIGAPVDLRVGPRGNLFYADMFAGRIQQIYEGAPPPVDNVRPRAVIDAPAPGTTYEVGDTIGFSGRAFAADGSALGASTMRWDLIQLHCPTEVTCHRHFVGSREAVASGSFVAAAHEEPSKLEIALTVTHDGRTDVVTTVLDRASASARRVAPEEPADGGGAGFLQEPTGP